MNKDGKLGKSVSAYTNILYILKQHFRTLIKLILYFLCELLEATWITCSYRDKLSFQLLYALSYKNSKHKAVAPPQVYQDFLFKILSLQKSLHCSLRDLFLCLTIEGINVKMMGLFWKALDLAALATEHAQFKDWWWKVQIGKCYYR